MPSYDAKTTELLLLSALLLRDCLCVKIFGNSPNATPTVSRLTAQQSLTPVGCSCSCTSDSESNRKAAERLIYTDVDTQASKAGEADTQARLSYFVIMTTYQAYTSAAAAAAL
ncbi:unnamed protein product [Ceratitis capitata]|uniref:(Mediterranean fruit fly) hypothetical protein n=1 Tax=Ceratitis capitata TaxID=7213 RepID=A0A811U3A1_CERCA|nr:unnamed protein product [Ceratitis capitata]